MPCPASAVLVTASHWPPRQRATSPCAWPSPAAASCSRRVLRRYDRTAHLYISRRATAREQKGQYDEAKADLKRAAELAPDDKAVPKLMQRVEAQIARVKAKEKKMYGKMFG